MLVFCLDCNDRDRMDEARQVAAARLDARGSAQELHSMLATDEMREAGLLVLANKMDLPGAIGLAQVSLELGLERRNVVDWTESGWEAFALGTADPGSPVRALRGNVQLLRHLWRSATGLRGV